MKHKAKLKKPCRISNELFLTTIYHLILALKSLTKRTKKRNYVTTRFRRWMSEDQYSMMISRCSTKEKLGWSKKHETIAGEWNNLFFQLIFFQHDRLSWPTSRDHRFGSRLASRLSHENFFFCFAHQQNCKQCNYFTLPFINCTFSLSLLLLFRGFFSRLTHLRIFARCAWSIRRNWWKFLLALWMWEKSYQQIFFYLPHKVIWMLINLATKLFTLQFAQLFLVFSGAFIRI